MALTVQTADYFSSADGKTTKKTAVAKKPAKSGKGREKVKNFLAKNDVFGKIAGVASALSQKSGDSTIVDGGGGQVYLPTEPTKKPMNPTLKWGLIIGGVAAVGFGVWYLKFRNK